MDDRFEPERLARWIICEQGQRWETAVRRFAPTLLPKERRLVLVNGSLAETRSHLLIPGPKVVLWQFDSDALVQACDRLIQGASLAPDSLQIAGCLDLPLSHQLALGELPVAAFVRHPEELPRLRPMLHGYFERHSEILD